MAIVRNSYEPSITSVSASTAGPYQSVTITGSGFAPATPGVSQLANRNLITFEQQGTVALQAVPYNATSSELTVYIPYEALPNNSYVTGTYQLCVTTDGRHACSTTPFTITSLATSGSQAGQVTLDYISQLEQLVAPNAQANSVAQVLATDLLNYLEELRAKIQSTMAGQSTSIVGIGTRGLYQGILTPQALATVDSMLVASNQVSKLTALTAQVQTLRARRALALGTQFHEPRPNAIGSPDSTLESYFLSAAQQYRYDQSYYTEFGSVTNNAIVKAVLCGIDTAADATESPINASDLIAAIQSLLALNVVTDELDGVFLQSITATPGAVYPPPGSAAHFQVSGIFTRNTSQTVRPTATVFSILSMM